MWESGWLHKIACSPSKTLTWILAFFCLGILLGPFFLALESLPFLFVACSAALAAFWVGQNERRLLFALLCFTFGIFRYQQSVLPSDLTTVQNFLDKSVRIEGTVKSDVERRVSRQQAVISDVRIAGKIASGNVLVRFSLYPGVRYGDRVVFSCRLESPKPFEGFAYDRQLASRGVLAICAFPEFTNVRSQQDSFVGQILALKDALTRRLHDVIPEPHASFIAGLLFGGSSALSSDMREDFSRTGLSHILAASGFNVSLFSVFLLQMVLQSPMGRRRGLILITLLLFLYAIAAGATPAVVRATVMAGILVLQTGIGRQPSRSNMLLLALSVMLIFNPQLLLDDVGFQLSFVATSALLFVFPRVKERFDFVPDILGIRTALASSCVAIVFTLPILLWHFGKLSILAPIANAFVLPFVPLLMILGTVGMIGGTVASMPAYGLSYVLLRITQTFSALPFASISVGFSHLLAILMAGLLLAWLIYDPYVVTPRTTD